MYIQIDVIKVTKTFKHHKLEGNHNYLTVQLVFLWM